MAGHPKLELASKARMAMFIGTFPKIHRHVKMVDKGLGAGKSQHGIVGEVCSAAEHLHLVVILNTASPAFIGTARYIANRFADEVILHKSCLKISPQR